MYTFIMQTKTNFMNKNNEHVVEYLVKNMQDIEEVKLFLLKSGADAESFLETSAHELRYGRCGEISTREIHELKMESMRKTKIGEVYTSFYNGFDIYLPDYDLLLFKGDEGTEFVCYYKQEVVFDSLPTD